MKTWIVDIEARKNDADWTLGPFSSFKKAQEAIIAKYGAWVKEYTDFDSNFNKGEIYTEEKTILIHERELD